MNKEELERFKEEQQYKNQLFNDFAIDSWCEESETINKAINKLTKEHFALLDIQKKIEKAIEYIKSGMYKDIYDDSVVLAKPLLEILGGKENVK